MPVLLIQGISGCAQQRHAEQRPLLAARVEEHDVMGIDKVDGQKPTLPPTAPGGKVLEQVDGLGGRDTVVSKACPCEPGVLAVVVVIGETVRLERFGRIRELVSTDLLVDDAQVPLALVCRVVTLLAQHGAQRRKSRPQLDGAWRFGGVFAELTRGVRIHPGLLNVLAGVEGRARRAAGCLMHVVVAERPAFALQLAQRWKGEALRDVRERAQLVHGDEQDVGAIALAGTACPVARKRCLKDKRTQPSAACLEKVLPRDLLSGHHSLPLVDHCMSRCTSAGRSLIRSSTSMAPRERRRSACPGGTCEAPTKPSTG